MTSIDSMKIFAFHISVKRESKPPHDLDGVRMYVGVDGHEVERRLIEDVEGLDDIKKGSVKINRKTSMSLEELCSGMKPHLEAMVKESKVKSDLLDLIGKLPVD